jgi:hypothetical protein
MAPRGPASARFAQELLIQLVNVGVVGEHDVAGIVEGEAVHLDGPAPAADAVVLLQQQGFLAERVGGKSAR